SRLEIYLSERATAKDAATGKASARIDFPELNDAIGAVENHATPTAQDVAYVWRKVVECYFALIGGGAAERKAKQDLRAYLFRAFPALGDTPAAVNRNLNRKILAVRRGEDGFLEIRDRRAEVARERVQAPEWEENIQLLAKHALMREGRISQAWRELYR